jgi:hypothetical protein
MSTRKLNITYCHRPLPVERRLPGVRASIPRLLRDAGHDVRIVGDEPAALPPDGVVWISGNPNWFPSVCRELGARRDGGRPLVLMWHSEPLPHPRAAALPLPGLHLREVAKIILRDARATDVYTNYFRLRRLARQGLPDVLVVSAPGRCAFLAERGIAAHWVPLGYHPGHGHDMGLERDIDALFLGALEIPRRRRHLESLRRAGIDVVAKGSWHDPECWGESRTKLINRARTFLNIQRYPGELSHNRLIIGGANKALVISEPMYDPSPYVPGKHYVSAPVEEMPDAVRYYLEKDDERQRIVEQLHRFVTQEMTATRSLSRIVALIDAHPKRQRR